METKGISWLASYPKSGNTWVRFFLTAYEYGFLNINDNIPYIRGDMDSYTHEVLSPANLENMPYHGHLLLRHALLLHKIYSKRGAQVILKTHHARVNIFDISLFPQPYTANSVYIVRDPRDVISSYRRHMGLDSIEDALDHMHNKNCVTQDRKTSLYMFLYSWNQHVASWNKDDVLVIRYEDIGKQIFKKILKQYEIPLDNKRLEKAIKLCDLNRLKQQEHKEGFLERKYQKQFFGGGKGWQNELTEEQVRRIEEVNGEVMERFDYKLEYL